MQKITVGNKSISTELPAFVMGIVNATPDSFYKESCGGIELAMKLIEQGADIIDIGAESTKPGHKTVSPLIQIERLSPIIKEIRKHSDIPISIDTRSAQVFEYFLDQDIQIMNDVSALQGDEQSVEAVKKSQASIILMHGYGLDENHQTNKEIISHTINFLSERTKIAVSKGICQSKILWDPGIGFGKTMEENVLLLKNTDNLCKEKFPLVMALSRKRIISFLTGCEEKDREVGTLLANFYAVQKGASILRVHDVCHTIDMLNMMKNLNK